MNKTIVTLLALSLVAIAPPASADEDDADCEKTQGWIGYTSTAPIKAFVEAVLNSFGKPVAVHPCEGEHWDGQDNVQPDDGGQFNQGCAPSPQIESGFIGACMNQDPNDGGASAPFFPLGSRIGWKVTGTSAEVYIGLDIAVVGRVVVYAGGCQGGGQGLEGNTSGCQGDGQARAGTYLRDNTLGGQENLLATIVSAPGITKGYVKEGDCDQATYQKGAETNDRTLCGRDNTAISVDVLLP